MSIHNAKPEHEVTFQELGDLLQKRAAKGITGPEILAIAANMVGKLMALQDQRTMTNERAIKIVIENIELGNQQAVEQLMNSKGNA